MELLEEDLRDGARPRRTPRSRSTSARRELRRLSVLASELLDLSRLDAAVQLRSEPVELGEIARAVAAEFALRGGRARRRARGRLPRPVLGARRPGGLRAGRAHPDRQRAALRAARASRSTSARPTCDRRVAVRVADRGPGVPPEEREHIFERFHRGKATSVESGFGLGLAIGRELAERMNGTLELADSYDARRLLRADAAR